MFCTSFPFHIKTNVHKNQYFLEEPPPCPMPFQQVLFNSMLIKVVKPCPTWAVSLLVLFLHDRESELFSQNLFLEGKSESKALFYLAKKCVSASKKWIINLVSRRKMPSKPIGKVRIISDLVFYNELNDT